MYGYKQITSQQLEIINAYHSLFAGQSVPFQKGELAYLESMLNGQFLGADETPENPGYTPKAERGGGKEEHSFKLPDAFGRA